MAIATDTPAQRFAVAVEQIMAEIFNAQVDDNDADAGAANMAKNLVNLISSMGLTQAVVQAGDESAIQLATRGEAWLKWVREGGKSPEHSSER